VLGLVAGGLLLLSEGFVFAKSPSKSAAPTARDAPEIYTSYEETDSLAERVARARRTKLQEVNRSYLAPVAPPPQELQTMSLSSGSGEDDLTASEDAGSSSTASKAGKRVTWADAERLKERDRSASPSPTRRKVGPTAARRRKKAT
jgi:hypothetical protein